MNITELENKAKVLRDLIPKGTRVELIEMDDVQAPPVGTRGTVKSIDDWGTIHPVWDTGSGLGLVYPDDKFRVLSIDEVEAERAKQKLAKNDEYIVISTFERDISIVSTGKDFKSCMEAAIDTFQTYLGDWNDYVPPMSEILKNSNTELDDMGWVINIEGELCQLWSNTHGDNYDIVVLKI